MAVIITGATTISLSSAFPDNYFISEGDSYEIKCPVELKKETTPKDITHCDNYKLKLSLPIGPVVKTVNVNVVKRNTVIPAGIPFGIKMFTKGVMVVGLSDIDINGRSVNPAKSAGIRTGDIILKIDSKEITSNEDLSKIIENSNGSSVSVTLQSGDKTKVVSLKPAHCDNGSYRAGMWVRDSSAGIGTMTFYDPATKAFGGLGHAVCDVDTGEILPIDHGKAVGVVITGITKGSSGVPGELRGSFANELTIGMLKDNNESGIFGVAENIITETKPMEMALSSEISEGPAYILTTVNGNYPSAYKIMIEKVSQNSKNSTKNMIIRITDQKLLSLTGGIVQGMSGSPIIQDDRVVGAVTHVFVNDPSRGYGIFIENMQKSFN